MYWKRAPRRYDNGGVAATYAVDGVPYIFPTKDV